MSTPQRFRPSHAAAGLLAAALILCAPAPAWAGEYEFNLLGSWGGAVYSVAVDPANPDIAYVGSGRRLVILDVGDPTNIIELGSIDVENVVLEVKVRDGYAYVGTYAYPYTFCIIDVSDPTSPEMVWHKTGHTYAHYGLELWGDFVYINESEDLEVRDISDPENPGGEYRVLPFAVYSHAIAGDLLCVGCSDDPGELRIYDLSLDPYNPPLLGSTPLPNPEFRMRPRSIAVEGDYVYMGSRTGSPDHGQTGGVAVVNISDAQAPFVTGYYNDFAEGFFPGYPWHSSGIAASGGYAYVAHYGTSWEHAKGLLILDVASDPANPTLASRFETHGSVMGVEVVGTRAYVMDEGEGLIILDVSDPENPVRFGRGGQGSSGWYSPAALRKLDKVGNLLYVTDACNGITILDVADALNPTLVGAYQTSEESGRWGNNWGIEVRDALAYLAAGWGHLEVVNVGDPANPVLVGTGEFLREYRTIGLELWGDVASVGYAPSGGGDFRFVNFDVSDLQNISVVGDVWVGSDICSIDVLTPHGIAFNARSGGGGVLTSVDTHDPTDPTVIFEGSPGGVDLVRDGNFLYLANESSDPNIGGLHIYEVDPNDPNNPNNHPSWVGHFPAYHASGVDFQDGVAYLMAGYDGARRLLALDVLDPEAPRLLGQFKTTGDMKQQVHVDGRYAYLTGNESGLTIVDVGVPGDLNGDGCVDQVDLGILLADWGCAGGDCPGDCDGDGDTDHADLGILLAHWGEGCP